MRMSPAEMKEALEKMNDDVWHRRDLEAGYSIYAEDVVFQRIPFPPVVGKAATMKEDEGTLSAFSDTHSRIDEIIISGDSAVIRWTWDGVHTGTMPSLGIPATGRQIKMSGCSVYHFRDGKIFEQWEYGDLLGVLQQLDVIPAPA